MDSGLFIVLAVLAIGGTLIARYALVEPPAGPSPSDELEDWKRKDADF